MSVERLRDIILIVAALAFIVWYGWGTVEMGLIQKLQLRQALMECSAKLNPEK